MQDDYKARLDASIAQLNTLRGKAALDQLEKITELALNNDDPDTVVGALCQQIRLANRLELFPPQVAALMRLQELYSGNPRYAFARDQVLWYHKWVIEPLAEHADIPAATIEEMIRKLETLFRAENVGLRPSHMLRCRTAWLMGNMDEARRQFALWQKSPAGRSDDCAACELNTHIEFLLADDRFDEVLPLAEPLFKGEMQCEEVPAITYSRLMTVALKADLPQLAEAMHQSTRRIVRLKHDLLAAFARHIFYLSITGRARQARRAAAVALCRAPAAFDYSKFIVYTCCAAWFTALTRDGIATIPLPVQFPLAKTDRNVSTPAGAAYCLDAARKLAQRFDSRNGNNHYGARVADVESFIRAYCTDSD